MATLSPARLSIPILEGLPLISRGKVRDTYDLGNDHLLVVATDGLSIFDFVLKCLIPEKGMILNAMSHFWFNLLAKHGIPNHFVVAGRDIDSFLPPHLVGNLGLQLHAMVVKKLTMDPVEFIARGYITGSGLKDYIRTGMVCGHELLAGLQDGDRLPKVIDTPTTKADVGHDEPLDAATVRAQYPREAEMLFQVFDIVSKYAEQRGIIFADTKLEFGTDSQGIVRLGDEVATPDSSRWWSRIEWLEGRKASERKAPNPFDKQRARQLGLKLGINKLTPENLEHVLQVHGIEIPESLVRALTQTYRYIFSRLTGERIEDYFRSKLGVHLPRPKTRIAFVFGSENDIPQVADLLKSIYVREELHGRIDPESSVNVISCHRNPEALDTFAASRCGGADVVVAAGGKAFALPGVLDAFLARYGYEIPVVGVALGIPESRALEAAQLSIEELPGQPVVMDEINAHVYTGADGFFDALERIAFGELPPPKERTEKPARLNIEF